ncbi:hypothetical protein AB1L30_10985 [Bremerella sp. JC817]|uniref:hypothetical protein n=1 Tax=Bremerella sp. JC817 TaxID=3231756 RepID=UPI0034595396
MANPEHEEVITVAYRSHQFRFAVQDQTKELLRGCFRGTDDEKAQILALLEKEDEDERQPWYLDDDGYRLDDDELFQMSPWSIVDGESCRKAVQRTMDCDTGEAWFCLTPWFLIGDELNRRPS